MKSVNFGIDLGTTNSLIAKYENGKVTIFKNHIGHKESLASVVAFRNDRILVGDKAREYMLKYPMNVFGSFKRRMGTDDQFYVVNIDDNITPIDLSALVLKELKQFIHTGENIEAAVVTIPASFDSMQSNATIKAAQKAGFNEVFLLQEPIAASLAYFNGKQGDENGYTIVYDLGGGTFDVALIEIKDGEMKIKDHEGNNFFGGVDFDRMILEDFIVPEIAKQTGKEDFAEQFLRKDNRYEKLYYELLYKAEEAKKELSYQNQTEIEVQVDIDGKLQWVVIPFTAEQFNNMIEPKIDESIDLLKSILNRSGVNSLEVKEIIMVGGSTFIPMVRERLHTKTGITVNTSIDPTSAIAVGAAYFAANKYYIPAEEDEEETEEQEESIDISAIPPARELTSMEVNLSYSKMSKDNEESLLIKTQGDVE